MPAAPDLVIPVVKHHRAMGLLSEELESRVVTFLSDTSVMQLHCTSCSWHAAAIRRDKAKKPAEERKAHAMRKYYADLDSVSLFDDE